MEIILSYRRSWGNDRFYPANDLAVGLAQLMKQSCLSVSQVRSLKKLGFTVTIQGEIDE